MFCFGLRVVGLNYLRLFGVSLGFQRVGFRGESKDDALWVYDSGGTGLSLG